jgi:signal transduction histidine kinase
LDNNFIISVKDEGPGFTEEDKVKLFAKFVKLSARPTGGENSTGLGLSIVKKLTELIGADIRVDSIYGQGAEFIIRFPIS